MFDGDSNGSLSVTLSTEKANGATLAVSLDSALALGFTDGGKRARLETDPAPGLFMAGVDSVRREAWGALDLGTTTVTTSFKTFVEAMFQRQVTPQVSPNDSVSVEIPPSTISLDFERDAETVHLERSPTTDDNSLFRAKNGNETLLSADTNDESQNGGASVDVVWEPGGAFSVTPGRDFSLDLTFTLKNVANKVENLQSFAAGDVVSFALSPGASAGSIPEAPPGSVALLLNDELDLALTHRTPGPELVVNQGSFVMSSKTAGLTTTVAAPKCLVYDPNSQLEHEILRGYGAAACPSVFK